VCYLGDIGMWLYPMTLFKAMVLITNKANDSLRTVSCVISYLCCQLYSLQVRTYIFVYSNCLSIYKYNGAVFFRKATNQVPLFFVGYCTFISGNICTYFTYCQKTESFLSRVAPFFILSEYFDMVNFLLWH